MSARLIALLVALIFFGSRQSVSCGDPIREELENAITDYRKKMEEIEGIVASELNTEEDRIRSQTKAIDRKRLELIQRQRDAFNDSREVPDIRRKRSLVQGIKNADAALQKAFLKAGDAYLRKKEDSKLAELELELKILRKIVPPIESNAILLFDGETLENWEPLNGELSYSVDQGHLLCFRNVKGSLQTRKAFSNFSFRFEYQFPRDVPLATPHGTGVMLSGTGSGNYVAGVDGKGAIEYQLKPGESGRLNVLYGKGENNPGLPRQDVKERQAGLWNQAEIRFVGNELTYYLNGEQVNHATLGQPVGCFIALRNGSMIRFRYLRIISPPPPLPTR